MKKVLLIFIVMIVFASADVFATSPDSIVGDWYTAEGTSVVQVYKCVDLFCGKMTLEGNELKVRGYVGFSLLGRTTVWTKKM